MQPLLEIQGVSKKYGQFAALKEISLNVYPGEIFALLGPNGAGKTTLIGCICGMVRNFTGSVSVAGYDVVRSYAMTRKLIGVVPQELNFDAYFSNLQLLSYQGGFFGIRSARKRAKELLADFSLLDKAHHKSRWLSGGMKRRLMICKALMHQPALLFLDEPTAGVDVELREELWSYVHQLRANGTTVVLTTHYLEEAEQLADRIGMIRDGKLILVERRDDLLENYGKRWLEIRFAHAVDPTLFSSIPDIEIDQSLPDRIRFQFKESIHFDGPTPPPVAKILALATQFDLPIVRVEGGRSSLEAIFRRIMAKPEAAHA